MMTQLTPGELAEPILAAIPFPQIDRTAFSIFGFDIYWYALSYLTGFMLGWILLKRITAPPDDVVGPDPIGSVVNASIIGVIIGGRLAYVLFYNFDYYIQNPIDIVMIRQGGISFHGGFVGILAAIAVTARRYGVPFLALGDCVSIVAPIGLFLGRIANFVNGELWGRVTDMPWGVVFPGAGPLPRHPSQIYEALLEGAVLFTVLVIMWQMGGRRYRGLISGAFIAGYGISRIIVEFFRQPDAQLGFLFAGATMGQMLSLPMVIAGALLMIYALRRA